LKTKKSRNRGKIKKKKNHFGRGRNLPGKGGGLQQKNHTHHPIGGRLRGDKQPIKKE